MPSAAAPAPPTAATERGKPADPTVQLQLLEGVRLFRAEQYEDALRVFQKVEADQQPADIGFYLGMALHKLGRHTAALSAFRSAQRSGLREPVADYYAAVSCYRLGMTTRARRGFLALVGGGGSLSAAVPPLGPRLQQGARSFLSALQPAPQEPAAEGGIPITRLRHERARQAAERLLASDDPEAAIEWIDEALHVLEETADPRERAEHSDALRQTLSRLRGKLGPRTRGADVLALEQRLAQ
jgi:tetratricopeptide (TPR) repeat protein